MRHKTIAQTIALHPLQLGQRRAQVWHGIQIATKARQQLRFERRHSNAGVAPLLQGAGPHSILEVHDHRTDEYLVLEDWRKSTRLMALTVMDVPKPQM